MTALIWTANIMIYRPSLYRPEKWKKRNHYYQESQVIVEVLPKFQAQIFNSVACSRLLKEFPICTRWTNQNNQGRLWMVFPNADIIHELLGCFRLHNPIIITHMPLRAIREWLRLLLFNIIGHIMHKSSHTNPIADVYMMDLWAN